MKKRAQEQSQQIFVQVMEKLSVQGDPYHTLPDILMATCRFFRFGCGFIYEAGPDGLFDLRETYSCYDSSCLTETLDVFSLLSPEELQQLMTLDTAVIQPGQDKTPLLTKLHQMFSCQLLVLVPIINNKDELIGLVGMSDRRGDITLARADFEVALCVLGMVRNQVKLRMYHDLILRMAEYDDLTGLPNRRKLVLEMDRTISNNDDVKDAYVLFFDLDKFKLVNDGLGHRAGDELLVQVSRLLQNGELTMGHGYRHSGDEFVLVYKDISVERLFAVISFLLKSFKNPWQLQDGVVNCTVSVGVAHYPQDGENAVELLHAADLAMYNSKPAGQDKVHFYERGAMLSAPDWRNKNEKGGL